MGRLIALKDACFELEGNKATNNDSKSERSKDDHD